MTDWAKVDRTLDEARSRLAEAKAEEQFQAVGVLCREALISVAQVVYDPTRHLSPDGVAPSETDAKRKLEAYLNAELAESSNEAARRHAKAALALANDLQHCRKATFRDAALCVEATTSTINIIGIVSGKRGPERSVSHDAVVELADRVETVMRAAALGRSGIAFPADWLLSALDVSTSELKPAVRYLEREKRIFYDPLTGMYSLSPMPWDHRRSDTDRGRLF